MDDSVTERLTKALDKIPPGILAQIVEDLEKLNLEEKEYASRFKKAIENVRAYYNEYLPKLSESSGITQQEVVDMLVESCLKEKVFEEGLMTFGEHVHNKGFEIEVNPDKFRVWIEKLADLSMYRRIIHMMGMGAFEDALVTLEIQKTLAPGMAPQAPTGGRSGKAK